MKNTVNDEMPLVDHLQEFRRRLLACLAVVAVTSAIAYAYVDELIALLSEPAGKLYFMNPAEVFFSYLEVAVFTGVLTAFPFIFYELWAFVRPGLRAAERKLLCRLLPAGVFLFYGGLLFSYFLVLPAAVRFFMGFATETLQPMFSLESYLSFFVALVLPFGIVFELPLLLLFLARMGIVSAAMLRQKRRLLIVFAFVFAAVVSPTTDIFTQCMIAVPMILLYEISIVLVKWLIQK